MCRTRCVADVQQDVAQGRGEVALSVGAIYTRVTRVADWAGWCSPCEREDRPLVLTRSGPGGLRAWLAGLGDDDRLLLLTCRVCGDWQHVPAREEDDPEVVLVEDDASDAAAPAAVAVLAAVASVVAEARQAPPVLVPAPRAELPAVEPVEEPVLVEVPDVDVLVVAEPSPGAQVPAQVPVPRIVTVPRSVVVPVPREAVEAAARVLAAARAQSQRTPSAAERGAPLDRSRRARSGPAPRRAARPVAARAPRPAAYAPMTLPPAFGLPAGTHQVVVAAAS